MNAPRKTHSHTCRRCGRTGTRSFSICYSSYVCTDGTACAKRLGFVLVPSGSYSQDIRTVAEWLTTNASVAP